MNSNDTNTKEKIMHAAKKLFSKYNFDYVGTRMIAAEAGVGQSAIFFHFGSKENLGAAVIDDILSYHHKYYDPICEKINTTFNHNAMTAETAYNLLLDFIKVQLEIAFNPQNWFALSFSVNARTLPPNLYKPLNESVKNSVEKPMAQLLSIYKSSSDMTSCYILSHAINTCIVAFNLNSAPNIIDDIDFKANPDLVKDELFQYLLTMIQHSEI